MNQYLRDLVDGKFVYEVPEIGFSVTQIVLEVLENEVTCGSFFIQCENALTLKGEVYSIDDRFVIKNPVFNGDENEIFYEFQSDGLIEGDAYEGELCIVCNQGEHALSFVAHITKKYGTIKGDKICDIDTFAEVAQSSWEEAYHLFTKPFFRNVLKDQTHDIQMVWETIRNKPMNYQSLEEFLVYIQKKNVVILTLEQYDLEVVVNTESIKKEVVLQKDTWGYVGIDVITEGDFFTVEKEQLTNDEFVGSICRFEYIIHAKQLHGGKNYGSITFKTMTQTFRYNICVMKEKQDVVGHKSLQMEQNYLMRVYELYLRFRLNQVRMGMWAQDSCGYLDQLLGFDKNNDWYSLMKAQVLLINSQKQEAQWILDQFRSKKIDKNRNYNLWGYYLYICTLNEKEPSFVNKKRSEIQKLYKKNLESTMLTWILLFLDEELNHDKEKKWHFLESYVQEGCHSPFIYMEAYYLLDKYTYLLTRISFFEIQVLNWAKKNRCITREIAMQFFQLLKSEKKFNPLVYGLCEGCFEQYQEREAVSAICSYLIKCNRSQTKYFRWFEKGIYFDLRITRLYEYYMMSMESEKLKQLPQKVSMYFRMNSSLNERCKALLYASIVENKEEAKDIFNDYKQAMELFTIAQLSKGAMNEELALLYKSLIGMHQITENIGRAYAKICFTNRLVCNNPNMSSVIVVHKQFKKEQKYPLNEQVAYIQLYTNDYLILFEDAKGVRYTSCVAYTKKALFETEHIVKVCKAFLPQYLPFVAYEMSEKKKIEEFSQRDWFLAYHLLEQEEVSDEFKSELCSEIIRYDTKPLPKQFWKWIEQRGAMTLIEKSIDSKAYEDAYELACIFGMRDIPQEKVGELLSYLIESDKKDLWIKTLAYKLFVNDQYDLVRLPYLVSCFSGSTKQLIAIFKAAKTKILDLDLLEEKILKQALYTTKTEQGLENVFFSYVENVENSLVEQAYIAYIAYQFVKNEMEISQQLCVYLKEKIIEKQEIPFICKIAYVKYLSKKSSFLAVEQEILASLMEELIDKGLYFSFYCDFDQEIAVRYQLYDKYILQYHTNPENKVQVHYRVQDESRELKPYKQAEMKHMYAGIFVKLFIVFVGETKEYFIEEEQESGKKKKTNVKLFPMCPISEQEAKNRYELLNEMLLTNQLKERELLIEQMKRYETEVQLTENVFTIL